MSALIDVPTLSGWLDEGQPVTLLDVRWSLAGGVGGDEYAAGHLPDAQLVNLDTDLADPPGAGGRHPLPEVNRFVAAMRALGVRQDVPVVCYDAADSMAAARAWWLLRLHGHPDVRVLDGGYAAWTAAGRPVQTEVSLVAVGDFVSGVGPAWTLDVDDVEALPDGGLLLDARDAVRFRGETEPVDPVAGHIPGAVNAPTKANVGPDGRFLPAAELRERFTALGVAENQALGVYCGSGVTATHEILALDVAGFEASLYPGSWSHWITDPRRPIATGP